MDTISRDELTGSYIRDHGQHPRRLGFARAENVRDVWYDQSMRILLGATAIALIALSGCSSGPTAEEIRSGQCEAFANLTPGWLETKYDMDTLSDASESNTKQSSAMMNILKSTSGNGRKSPYDCNNPADAELFRLYVENQSRN